MDVGQGRPLLRVDPSLRPAHALRAARALQVAVRRRTRTAAKSPSWTRRLAAWSSSSRRAGLLDTTVDRGHRRPRREPRRARRGRARVLRLRKRHAGAVRHPGAVRPDARPPRGRPGARRRPDADGARPARRAEGAEAVSGTSLRAADDRRPKLELELEGYAEAMYPLHHYGWSDLRAIRAGRYKAIDAPRPELYDLQNRIPARPRNIFEAAPDARRPDGGPPAPAGSGVSRRRRAGRRAPWTSIPRSAPASRPSGYVGSFVARRQRHPDGSRRPEGQDRSVQPDVDGPRRAAEKGGVRPGRGDANVGARRPTPTSSTRGSRWATCYFRERQYREAIEQFSTRLTLKPDYDLAVINIAPAYRNLGDDDAALAGFERYLDASTRRTRTSATRWARSSSTAATSRAPRRSSARLSTSTSNVASGQERAGRDRVPARRPRRRPSGWPRRRWRPSPTSAWPTTTWRSSPNSAATCQLAEKEYLLELEQHPDAYKAAFNLSRLYAQIGEPGARDRRAAAGARRQPRVRHRLRVPRQGAYLDRGAARGGRETRPQGTGSPARDAARSRTSSSPTSTAARAARRRGARTRAGGRSEAAR